MNDRVARVSVRILEKEYQVACPVEERTDLLDAAEYLNSKMREIRDSGSVLGLDRVAVMAGLNIANELLKDRRKESSGDSGLMDRVRRLSERVESAITRGKQLEI